MRIVILLLRFKDTLLFHIRLCERICQYASICKICDLWNRSTTVLWSTLWYDVNLDQRSFDNEVDVQYIPRNMHTVFALLCFVVVIHWLIFPYPSGLLHWHCGNLTIAPVPAKQPWWIWINTSCEFIMNDCITTTKQSTTKPCAHFLGYTVGILSDNATYRVCYTCKITKFVYTKSHMLSTLSCHVRNNSANKWRHNISISSLICWDGFHVTWTIKYAVGRS